MSDDMVDLTADPWTWVPSENGYDAELDPGLPPPLRLAMLAWDDSSAPCAGGCGTQIGHVEFVTEDRYGREIEGVRWVGCFGKGDPVQFFCEDCAEL